MGINRSYPLDDDVENEIKIRVRRKSDNGIHEFARVFRKDPGKPDPSAAFRAEEFKRHIVSYTWKLGLQERV
jgi:hypothetical protein